MARRQSARFQPIASLTGTEGDTSTNREVALRSVVEHPDSSLAKHEGDGDEDGQVQEVVSVKLERVEAQGYFSRTGGFIQLVKEQVELELRISEDGSHLELGVLQQREVLQVAFVLPPEPGETEEDEAALTNGNCCTGSCFCDPSRRCRCKSSPVLKTQALRELKNKGSELIREHLFPLLSTYGRAITTLLELLTALVMLAVALPTFVKETLEGPPPVTDSVRLSISVISVILAAIDATFVFGALCRRRMKSGADSQGDTSELNGMQYRLMEEPNKLSVRDKFDKYYSDLVRVVIAEILIYPTVICNIFDHATMRTYEGNHSALEKFAFARFILSAIGLIVHVYLFRLIVIGGTIVLLEKARRGKSEKLATDDSNSDKSKLWEDSCTRHRARRGIVLEIFFLVHIFGQMLTQSLMLGAIWSKFQCENPEDSGTTYVSPFTWTMIGLGFILPIAGTFTFFIPTYYWAQEFPIDFMVTMLSALKKRGFKKLKQGAEDAKDKLDEFLKRVEKATTKAQNVDVVRKAFFPLLSPFLIVLSCAYDIVLLSFVAFFFAGSNNNEYFLCPFGPSNNNTEMTTNNTSTSEPTMNSEDLDSFQFTATVRFWLLYSAVAIVLGNIANVIVVLIGLFWMSTITILLLVLTLISPVWAIPLIIAFIGHITGRF